MIKFQFQEPQTGQKKSVLYDPKFGGSPFSKSLFTALWAAHSYQNENSVPPGLWNRLQYLTSYMIKWHSYLYEQTNTTFMMVGKGKVSRDHYSKTTYFKDLDVLCSLSRYCFSLYEPCCSELPCLKVHSYYAAKALHCCTAPYCTEIAMSLHCGVAWKLNSF